MSGLSVESANPIIVISLLRVFDEKNFFDGIVRGPQYNCINLMELIRV